MIISKSIGCKGVGHYCGEVLNMLPYNNKVAEKRKERKEKPKKQAERARELQKERMKKKGKW